MPIFHIADKRFVNTIKILKQENSILAIYLFRLATGLGLAAARRWVDTIDKSSENLRNLLEKLKNTEFYLHWEEDGRLSACESAARVFQFNCFDNLYKEKNETDWSSIQGF